MIIRYKKNAEHLTNDYVKNCAYKRYKTQSARTLKTMHFLYTRHATRLYIRVTWILTFQINIIESLKFNNNFGKIQSN